MDQRWQPPGDNSYRQSVLAVGSIGSAPALAAAPAGTHKIWRAAVIGRTGGGDYGHGYDQVFKGLDNVSVEAVADHDPAGLDRAAQRSGAKRRYADYRAMLDREQPELVCIAPRFPDCHVAMAQAAVEYAKGIFLEKPFADCLPRPTPSWPLPGSAGLRFKSPQPALHPGVCPSPGIAGAGIDRPGAAGPDPRQTG